MKASARNQFTGTITHIHHGNLSDEIELSVDENIKIMVMITHASSRNLHLTPGKRAIGLVKASSIILVENVHGYVFSARNQLTGAVSAIKIGAVNAEVDIQVTPDLHVTAIITNESADNMALVVGKSVTALFKASSVILATTR